MPRMRFHLAPARPAPSREFDEAAQAAKLAGMALWQRRFTDDAPRFNGKQFALVRAEQVRFTADSLGEVRDYLAGLQAERSRG